ncbi:hypothetical protein ACPV5L_13075 [Vibrio astriarenae]|jgi:P pilus assembly chaperone PapD
MRYLLSVIILVFSSFSEAYSVQPMVSEISPAGSSSQLMMQVENTGSTPLELQIDPYQLKFDEQQKEQLVEAFEDILVIPPTTIIQPGKFQSILVRYIGDPTINSSKSYRIVFDQAEVQNPLDKGRSSVKVKYQFLTLLNVKPANSSPDIKHERTYTENGKWFLELTNNGTSYARLSRMEWKVGSPGSLLAISANDIRSHVSGNLLLPQQTRSFEFIPFDGIEPQAMAVQITESK